MDSDGVFAELVVAQGIAKREQVAECLAELAKLRDAGKPVPTLGELLVRRGYLTVESLKTVGAVEAAPVKDLPPDAQRAAADPANLLGRYVRVAILGRGGMGEVWRAWDRDLARWVALKFLHEKAVIDRFRQEAQTSARLNHPNIAAVYEVSEHGGVPFIAMQFVKGRPLSEFARKDARASAEMLLDAALAVHHAHQQDVIHRDLKPGNIMVEDGTRRVYVLDFGLARRTDVKGPMSVTGVAIGTPAFMPPEQAAGERADERSDVYGLGATLYELLTGRAPVAGDQVLDILIKVLEGDITPPRALDAGIDADLETIVMTAMAPEPERRYASAKALADDLQRWLDGDAISARPASIAYRARKYLGRRKAKTAAVVLAVALAAAVGIYWIGIRPQTREAAVFDPIRRKLADLPPNEDALRHGIALLDAGLDEFAASWDGWMRKGDLHERLREGAKAMECYARAAALHPRLAEAHYRTGRVLMDFENDPARARAAFELALKADPGNELALVGTARLAILAREWTRAWEALDRAEESGRHLAELHFLRAFCFAERDGGRFDTGKAIESYGRALERDPQIATAYFNRGILLSDHGKACAARGQMQESLTSLDLSIADYGRCLALWPTHAPAFLNRANARSHRADALDVLRKTSDASGERRLAIDDCTRAHRLNPGDATPLARRGRLREEIGDAIGAAEDYALAISVDPDDAEAWSHRGSMREAAAAGMPRERRIAERRAALADHDEAVKRAPSRADYLVNRAGVRRRLGDYAEAQADLDRALALDASIAEAWSGRASVHADRAQDLHDGGDSAGALKAVEPSFDDFKRALELDPTDRVTRYNRSRAHALKGDALARLGRRDEAVPCWKEAFEDVDRSVREGNATGGTLYQRGRLRQLLGEEEAAIADLTKALELDPTLAVAAYKRGHIHKALGKTVDAIKDFTKAMQIDPDYADAWLARGVVYAEYGDAYHRAGRKPEAEKSWTQAESDYARAIALRPRDPQTRFNRGVMHVQRGDPESAIRDFTTAIEIDPSFAGAWANRAGVKLHTGDFTGAEADAVQALSLAPPDWPSRKAVERIRDEARAKK